MRNSTSGGSTPKITKAVQDQQSSSNNAAEKNSAKKLKQARLPFKVIAPSPSPVGLKPTTTTEDAIQLKNGQNNESRTTTTDARKRKLSYDDSDGGNAVKDADGDNVSKENIEVLAAASKKKKIAESSTSDGTPDDVIVFDDDSNDSVPDTLNTVAATKESSTKTPKDLSKGKRKGAGTPNSSSSSQNEKTGGASKLQIKLPLSAVKKSKRRKSKLAGNNSIDEGSVNKSCAESSDDIETVAGKLNPQKRKKLDIEDKKRINVKNHKVETILLDSESEVDADDKDNDVRETLKSKSIETSDVEVDKNKDKLKKSKKESPIKSKKESPIFSDKIEKAKRKSTEKFVEEIELKSFGSSDEDKNEDKEDLNESIQSDNDNEADDETDNIAAKSANISSDISEDSKSKNNNTVESLKNTDTGISSTKILTPKQTKLMNQRRKAREEKERKLQEEKMKKQLEKEEKEQAKKRERDEKEDQRRREREEKEEQKRKEREEKERKRIAEVEAKNEEKRKKTEAKEEELRKKEEDRKRKEQEKEEAELKKKKAAQAFTKFFVPKAPIQVQINNEEDSNTGDGTKLLAFRPFQVKGDMKIAPLCRKIFTEDAKCRLDSLLGYRHKIISPQGDAVANEENKKEENIRQNPLSKSELYLSELRAGKILPGKWRRPSTESKDDVILVEDDLDRVGQAIVEDTPAYVREQMRVKFFKFHDNRRPPYYGTWRKKSSIIKPTKPFKQDKKFFDYEVDSDDEWEEEEPGESLEDGSDDDKEKESEDEDYEVDNEWFVPHGHLSDEELQNEDEFGTGDDNTREAQKAKLQILQQEFVQEMKKKTEKIKPRLIGCIWVDENGNQPTECAKIIWDTLKSKAMLYIDPPLVEEPEVDRSTEPSSPSASNGNAEKATTLKPIVLSDNMIKDLTRLIHGNNHSKNFLINEYIAYIEKTEESIKNGDLRKPLKSVVRDKIEEMAEWQIVNATASNVQETEQVNVELTDSTKKKKKGKRRLCWVVKQEMLDKMDLSLLELQNTWKYTLPPKFVKADKDVKPNETTTSTQSTTPNLSNSATIEDPKIKNTTSQITKFTKILTAEEKVKKLQTPPPTPSSPVLNPSNIKTVIENKTKTPTSQTSKEKKRVPLLMSVARGQQISTPAKNKLISQFLQKGNKDAKQSSPTTRTSRINATTSPTVEDDDVVILD